MIDAETKIFNRVHAAVAPLCAAKKFVSVQVVSPVALPAASLVEIGNSTVRSRQDTSLRENYCRLAYQLDVYAKTKGKCREILAAADDEMIKMNFCRFSGQYIDNPGNPTVFRYVARYEAEIDRNGNLYRVS